MEVRARRGIQLELGPPPDTVTRKAVQIGPVTFPWEAAAPRLRPVRWRPSSGHRRQTHEGFGLKEEYGTCCPQRLMGGSLEAGMIQKVDRRPREPSDGSPSRLLLFCSRSCRASALSCLRRWLGFFLSGFWEKARGFTDLRKLGLSRSARRA